VPRAARARAGTQGLRIAELFALNFVDDAPAEEVATRHRAFGERLERDVAQRFESFSNVCDPDRRLRIGYVSGEFYLHPVARFMIPLLERRDRLQFEVYCYSVGLLPADSFTRQVEARSDAWREARALNDSDLADLVHRDSIDILVDLSGHSGISRLATFAQQPSPVQATWLGNLNTTGMTRIQYRITDAYSDPPGLTEHLHAETLMRLPQSQCAYRPYVAVDVPQKAPFERRHRRYVRLVYTVSEVDCGNAIAVGANPAGSSGIAPGFGRRSQGRMRDDLVGSFARHGVGADRITLLPFMSLRDYLQAFGDVDIALDTAPYSGGTTTCDALWMGVPVLTLPGVRPAVRSAASILSTMGLSEWIATSPEDYVRRAVRLAGTPETIAQLRRSLRDRMTVSPLMDEVRFARSLEQTLSPDVAQVVRERARSRAEPTQMLRDLLRRLLPFGATRRARLTTRD
jgi:predicted O-linked N-acetylglucosamine transferase (SPINDLY family)